MYEIIIPGELPDFNFIIAETKKGNRNYQPYNKIKQEHTERVAWIIKSKIKKPLPKVDIEIEWVCKDKRKDKDNISAGIKFILDGMVQAGAILNDGWKEIGDISHKFSVDKDNPRIIVRITPCNTL